MEEEKIIIMHARGYDFTKQGTDERIAGVKITYVFTDKLEPVKLDDTERGYGIAESSLSIEAGRQIKDVPGIYKAKFSKSLNAKKQIIQKLVGVEFVSSLSGVQQKIS